ncbi:MAG: hypothetical protein AAGF19_00240 [Pseudomonadota bacterium]
MVLPLATNQIQRPAIIGLDASVLAGWYQARTSNAALIASQAIGAGAQQSASSARLNASPAVVTPWDLSVVRANPFETKLRDALINPKFVDLNDSFFDQSAVSDDEKALFAAYRGLSKLAVLAEHAAAEDTFSGGLPGLDRRFQDGLTEVSDYVSGVRADTFQLFQGEAVTRASTSTRLERSQTTFTGQIAHTGAFEDPVDGLSTTDAFSLSITKSGTTTDLTIDLSTLSGPLTLTAIADEVNTQLEAGGFITRLNAKRIVPERFEDQQESGETTNLPNTFGFEIKGSSIESLQFSAAGAEASLMIAGRSGTGDTLAGQITKVSSLGAGTSVNTVSNRVEPEGEETSLTLVASALDSEGNLITLGTTDADNGSHLNRAEQDVFLTKYDSTGEVIWSKLLGSQSSATAFDIAVDSEDKIVVAGSTTGDLVDGLESAGEDAFLVKFDKDGSEEFTRQIGTRFDQAGLAVATGPSGEVYLAGRTKSTLDSSLSSAGGQDAFLIKFDAGGTEAYRRQFGTAGTDETSAVDVDAAGNVFTAGVEDGQVIVRKFSGANGTDPAMWTYNAGTMDEGSVAALKVEGSSVYVAGATTNASLGGGTVVDAHSGSHQDGFLFKLQDAGASANAEYSTFIGGADKDSVTDIAVDGATVYLAGELASALDGQAFVGKTNAYAAQIAADGSRGWVHQFSGQDGRAQAQGIGFDADGYSVLDVLGLPNGTVNPNKSRYVVDRTTVREGQSFFIKADERNTTEVSIDKDDSLQDVAFKINTALLVSGRAKVQRGTDGDYLTIEAFDGKRIEVLAGNEGEDALAGLGLAPSVITSKNDDETDPSTKLAIGLALPGDLSLRNKTEAARTLEVLNEALTEIRNSYRTLTTPPAPEQGPGVRGGAVPDYLNAQIANFQAALDRLAPGASTQSIFV